MAFKPDAVQPETISPREALLRQQTGVLANGQPAPPVAIVDSQAGPAPTPRKPSRFVPDQPVGASPPPPVEDETGKANKAAEKGEHGPVQDVLDMLKAVPSGVVQMLQGIGDTAMDHPILGNIPALVDTFKRVAANPSGTLTSVSNAVTNATPEQVGRNVLAPIVAGGAANEGVGLARSLTAGGATDAAGQLGLRTATGPGATMAGNTAGPTLDIQNQRVATNVLGADAGVPHTSKVNAATLETAREAPGQVLDTGASLIPTGPLSPAARSQVAAARGPDTITKPTPNVATQINDIESSLLAPDGQFTGEQIRATRNSLNSDANAGANSTDADTRAIAVYKRNVVTALDQHIADTMPPNSAISPEMIANARSTLAKNYQLQDLIGKGGDINLQALAKLHRDNPNMLTGNTRTVAQFASDHPEVTGGISDATRISPPSMLHDIGNVNILHPVSSVGRALFGGLGRRLLRGAPGEAIGAAMQQPVAGLGGEFDLQPLTELHTPGEVGPAPPRQQPLELPPGSGQVTNPTGGLTASPPTGPAPAGGAPPGDIPLADLLSHGVEQPPAPGLSAGPMGAPEPQGIPFQRNAAHEAGGLELSPEDWLNSFMRGESNRDYAGVKSQGVPEGIVQRANNASGESAASLEAISRGTRPLAVIDQDGNEAPLLRDVTQADRTAPKGKIILDTSTGEIIDRGGLSQARAIGLRNRWATVGRKLGDNFVMGGAGG